jgi:exopolysaccharide biosynthesis polyprenyl glycosylphosphotransferase
MRVPRFIDRLLTGYPRPGEGVQGMTDNRVTPSRPLPGVSRGAADAAVELSRSGPGPEPRKGPETQRWWRDTRRRRMLAAADLCAAAIATVIAVPSLASLTWALLFLPLWIVVAQLLGLYDRDQRSIRHLTIDELGTIAAWGVICSAGLGLLSQVTPIGDMSLGAVAGTWALAVGSAFALRAVARGLWRRFTPPEVTAVVGDGELAWAARRKLELFRDMHLEIADHPPVAVTVLADGGEEELRDLVRGVDRVIVASERIDPAWIGTLNGVCREEQVKLSVVSPLRGRAGAAPILSEVADLPVLEYDTRDVSRSTTMLKRAFDVVVSAFALAILAPFFPFVALAIRLDSRGPVIFRQVRAGLGGRPFRILKLRTMYEDAEDQLSNLVAIDELDDPMFKLRSDPRVTRVGRRLRRFSIDELPQLVNVLRGEMSIVGPRPEWMGLVERYRPEHRFRLAVKPGMTGPMQVFGRGALNFQERLAVELDYVENLSLSRDLRIIAQTVPAILRGTGAY